MLHLRAWEIILRRPQRLLRHIRARKAAEAALRLFKELLYKGARPLPRIGHKYELVLCAGRGDVEQPPLLFKGLALLIVKPAAARHGRQYTVQRVDNDDAVIFESFTAVYRAEDELAVRGPVFRGNILQLPQPLQEALRVLFPRCEDRKQIHPLLVPAVLEDIPAVAHLIAYTVERFAGSVGSERSKVIVKLRDALPEPVRPLLRRTLQRRNE